MLNWTSGTPTLRRLQTQDKTVEMPRDQVCAALTTCETFYEGEPQKSCDRTKENCGKCIVYNPGMSTYVCHKLLGSPVCQDWMKNPIQCSSAGLSTSSSQGKAGAPGASGRIIVAQSASTTTPEPALAPLSTSSQGISANPSIHVQTPMASTERTETTTPSIDSQDAPVTTSPSSTESNAPSASFVATIIEPSQDTAASNDLSGEISTKKSSNVSQKVILGTLIPLGIIVIVIGIVVANKYRKRNSHFSSESFDEPPTPVEPSVQASYVHEDRPSYLSFTKSPQNDSYIQRTQQYDQRSTDRGTMFSASTNDTSSVAGSCYWESNASDHVLVL